MKREKKTVFSSPFKIKIGMERFQMSIHRIGNETSFEKKKLVKNETLEIGSKLDQHLTFFLYYFILLFVVKRFSL